MKKSTIYRLISLVIVLTMVLSFAGCASKAPASTEPAAKEPETTEPAAEPAATITSMGIGTASVGGALYAFGGGFVNVWNSIGISASAEVTGGSVHNSNLIQAGELGSALISQGCAYQAWTGTGLFAGQEPAKNLRAALPLHPSYIHGWTLDKNVKSYADLAGKIVCGGPAGGTSDEYNKEILDILGVPVKKFVNAAFADASNMLRDGLVDVFVSSMGVPASAVAECASTLNAKIIGVSEEEANKVIEKVPFYAKMAIPANTYAGQTEPLNTIADVNIYFFNKDIPEEVVYKFVKAAFEQVDELATAFAGAKDMTHENVRTIAMPLHPGAYRYYKEMGVEVPEAAMPID